MILRLLGFVDWILHTSTVLFAGDDRYAQFCKDWWKRYQVERYLGTYIWQSFTVGDAETAQRASLAIMEMHNASDPSKAIQLLEEERQFWIAEIHGHLAKPLAAGLPFAVEKYAIEYQLLATHVDELSDMIRVLIVKYYRGMAGYDVLEDFRYVCPDYPQLT